MSRKTPTPSTGATQGTPAADARPDDSSRSHGFTVPLPDQLFDGDDPHKEDLVWEDDFRQNVIDVAASQRAIEQLQTLMRAAHAGDGDAKTNLLGMAVLLEGVQGRLSCSLDSMVQACGKFGFGDARELPGVQW